MAIFNSDVSLPEGKYLISSAKISRPVKKKKQRHFSGSEHSRRLPTKGWTPRPLQQRIPKWWIPSRHHRFTKSWSNDFGWYPRGILGVLWRKPQIMVGFMNHWGVHLIGGFQVRRSDLWLASEESQKKIPILDTPPKMIWLGCVTTTIPI